MRENIGRTSGGARGWRSVALAESGTRTTFPVAAVCEKSTAEHASLFRFLKDSPGGLAAGAVALARDPRPSSRGRLGLTRAFRVERHPEGCARDLVVLRIRWRLPSRMAARKAYVSPLPRPQLAQAGLSPERVRNPWAVIIEQPRIEARP